VTNDKQMTQQPTVFKRVKFAELFQRRFGVSKVGKLYSVSIVMLTIALFLFLSVQLGSSASASGEALGDGNGCPVHMVRVGPLCVDKYEATVWSEPPTSDGSPRGTRFGLTGDDYPCSFNGNGCSGANPIYAASLPSRRPSAFITWFQAQQACLNVGKRLLTNAEWQGAAAGTPTEYEPGADDGVNDCNTSTAHHVVRTGSRKSCVSSFGAFDMVGNLIEWTADWIQGSSVPFAPSVALLVQILGTTSCLEPTLPVPKGRVRIFRPRSPAAAASGQAYLAPTARGRGYSLSTPTFHLRTRPTTAASAAHVEGTGNRISAAGN